MGCIIHLFFFNILNILPTPVFYIQGEKGQKGDSGLQGLTGTPGKDVGVVFDALQA